ncbi:MFS-type transporter SLC18B1-like [Lingula anatina]|uniref:MFS-type transporter SLC18B1-like n=1 Tax=Lingula anatina TaxID=7574 RepID=A0A1S3JIX1_LINAN|nr:MFS-type transporter SLC18B1-like [Lingula anatina]|eukprot:XP_013410071.1 MFS-type transporter SLC18B1-like [Lingula anatina]
MLFGCYSVLQPFLRDEAVAKGLSLTAAGAIFGCYEVAKVSCSLFIGSRLSLIGARWCYWVGLVVLGTSSFLFGFLGEIKSGQWFLGLGITVRVMESVGAAMAMTANYAIITREFRNEAATAYGFLEMSLGLGLVFGPLAGGGLYQLGGFGRPFFVFGPAAVILGVWAFFTLPDDDKDEKSSQHGQVLQILKKPVAVLEYIAVFILYFGIGSLSPTLGRHLENVDSKLEGNHVMIGLAFSLIGLTYSCTVPLFGLLSNKLNLNKVQVIVGLFVSTLGYTLVGPWIPVTSLYPNGEGASWSIYLGSCTLGIGSACTNVAVMADRLLDATASGLPDDMTTYGSLSATFETSMGIGDFSGPIIGGSVLDSYPFSTLSGVLTGLCLGDVSVLLMYLTIAHALRGRTSGYAPMIHVEKDYHSSSKG